MAGEESALAAIRSAGKTIVGSADARADSSTGIVDGEPESLAQKAGLTLDEYALARMVSSEVGSGTAEEQLAVAECAVNQATHLGKSTSALLLVGRTSAGKFGQQGTGKWASTARPPTQKNVEAAKGALSGTQFAKGARDFFDPGGQVVGASQGVSKITKSASDYIAENEKRGLVWVGQLPNVDATRLMMFVDKGKVSDPQKNFEQSQTVDDIGSVVAFLFLLGAAIVVGIYAGGIKIGI